MIILIPGLSLEIIFWIKQLILGLLFRNPVMGICYSRRWCFLCLASSVSAFLVKRRDMQPDFVPVSSLPPSRGHSGQSVRGVPWWLSGKESACQCQRPRFNP